MISTSINHYAINGKLGQGGMGEVYRAIDTRLHRQVALKVLPAIFASDKERMARFEREAQVLASLNHPNIASIYGIEESNGTRVLVMELAEGEDLSERIARGRMPLDEAIPIALQIAEALENAHAQGVVHRDLKPANVKIAADGSVKVLDFGLAKALDPAGTAATKSVEYLANSPTALGATVPGLILGTAAYMSPEQARGKPVDKRADVWAFGVLLREMLTGKPLFTGETLTDVLSSVVGTKEVELNSLPPGTPASIRNLLARCLRKDPRRRLPDIGAARLELEDTLTGASSETETRPTRSEEAVPTPRTPRKRERWAWAGIALALAGLSAFLLFQRVTEATEPRPVTQFVLETAEDLVFDEFHPSAVSPDGRSIAFVGGPAGDVRRLWIRRLEAPEVQALPGTEGAVGPFWSPDSSSIGFVAGGQELKRLVLQTGTVHRICALPRGDFNGGTWNGKDLIVFSTGGANANLYSVPATGGEARLLTPHDESRAERSHFDPTFMPDGEHLLLIIDSSNSEYVGLHVISVTAPRERQRIQPSRARALYASSGHLLFAREGILLAQPFDPKRLTMTGDAVTLASAVGAWSVDTNEGLFSVSRNGLVTWMSQVASEARLEWISRDGKRLGTVGEPRRYGQIVLSPDGRRLAAEVSDSTGRYDLWVIDVGRGVASRLTTDASNDERDPVWSPDSLELVYSSDASGDQDLLRKGLQGTEPAVPLRGAVGQTRGVRDIAECWFREPNTLLFTTIGPDFRTAWSVALDSGGKPEELIKSRFGLDEPQISPDGRWLAYISTESGRHEVYVQPFRRRGESVRVSTSGGGQPKWRGDGKELFYLSPDRSLMAVDVREGVTGAEIGIPAVLVPANQLKAAVQGLDYDDYAVANDGQRFLIKTPLADRSSQRIHVMLNWPSLLPK